MLSTTTRDGCACLVSYPLGPLPSPRAERAAWALFPLAMTTLVCGLVLASFGFYVYAARMEGRLYLGFSTLAGIFAVVAGGAGVAAARSTLDPTRAGGYVLTSLLSALSAAGVLVGSYRAVLDFPTYGVGAVGGAMSALAAITLGTDLAGVGLVLFARVMTTAKTRDVPQSTLTRNSQVHNHSEEVSSPEDGDEKDHDLVETPSPMK